MNRDMRTVATALVLFFGISPASATESPYAKWKNGISNDPAFFPLAVWLQSPSNAARYKAVGVNLYVGLHRGPNAGQIETLKKHGMHVICEQNEYARKNLLNEKIVVGWCHTDEPDNARPLKGPPWNNSVATVAKWWPQLKGNSGIKWGVPLAPAMIQQRYERLRTADPTRPVFLNLSCGVINPTYLGRNPRTRKFEDYPEYLKGCDIGCFDVYPACSNKITDQLWLVPDGVGRMLKWVDRKKPIWTCIETTQISHPSKKATPKQIRAEVWMAIIRGATGIVYFAHTWKPSFSETGLLDDPKIARAVGDINKEVAALAKVINGPTIENCAMLSSESADAPLDVMCKRHEGTTYIFAVNLRGKETKGTISIKGVSAQSAEVIGEGRTVDIKEGKIEETFAPWDVFLCKLGK